MHKFTDGLFCFC